MLEIPAPVILSAGDDGRPSWSAAKDLAAKSMALTAGQILRR
jgi:hypothetical protein